MNYRTPPPKYNVTAPKRPTDREFKASMQPYIDAVKEVLDVNMTVRAESRPSDRYPHIVVNGNSRVAKLSQNDVLSALLDGFNAVQHQRGAMFSEGTSPFQGHSSVINMPLRYIEFIDDVISVDKASTDSAVQTFKQAFEASLNEPSKTQSAERY